MKIKLINCVLLVSVVFLSACSACDRIWQAQEMMVKGVSFTTTDKPNVANFVFRNNRILFEAEINGQKDTVILDLGLNSPMVRYVNPENKPDVEFVERRIMALEKTKIKTAVEPVKIEYASIEVQTQDILMLKESVPICSSESTFSYPVLLGKGAFPHFGSIGLNFSKKQIFYYHDHRYVDSLDLTEYQEVKSKFDNLTGSLLIFLTIDGKEYECVFDTGNSGRIILKDKKRAKSGKATDVRYEGSYALDVSGVVKARKFCVAPNETVKMSGRDFNADVVYVSNIHDNNVGIQFISQFDWIIDNNYDKVYFKPREVERKPFDPKPYSISTIGGELTIVNRCLDKEPKFKVGAVIESVNGETVTQENICHFYDLLKKAEDWSQFDVKVK